jgi:hypothetical protein
MHKEVFFPKSWTLTKMDRWLKSRDKIWTKVEMVMQGEDWIGYRVPIV